MGWMMFRVILVISLFFLCPFTVFAMRDPTQPADVVVQQSDGLRIDAVLISPIRRLILVHGKYLTVGDKAMGMKIIAIEKNAVTVEGEDGVKTLPIANAVVKKPAIGEYKVSAVMR
jgi:hypothetical protein